MAKKKDVKAPNIFLVDKIEMIALSKLKRWERNPRNNQAAVEPVAKSIQTFGMLVPVLINNANDVLAGDTRVQACDLLKLPKVPCVRVEHLTHEQQVAYNIADNKLAELATWDQDKMRENLNQLREQFERQFPQQQYDFTLLGYQAAEIELIMNGWNSNAQRLGDIQADNSPAQAKIVVRCRPENEEKLRTVIQKAINRSAIEEVTIA